MAHPSKRKGDNAERELEKLLHSLLGFTVRRKLGAGRKDDQGDLEGIPNTTVQVTANDNGTVAFRVKPQECEIQQHRAGTTFGFTAVRLRGGVWRFVLTPDQLATYVRESLPVYPADQLQLDDKYDPATAPFPAGF